ncbi:MAG: rRNA maturation RNase YbeY [Bacteroidota bacterium]
MPLTFHTADVKFSLKEKKKLKEFIKHQISDTGHQTVNLSFIFCSDEYLLNINKKFLNHDYYTDIITFPLSDEKDKIEAEIYISVERVKENSLQLKDRKSEIRSQKSESEERFSKELHRVMFHGVLHLLGYKDKTKVQKAEMRKMEDKWLKQMANFK